MPLPLATQFVHHVTLNVTDLDRAVDFLERVLGFRKVPRTDFPGALAWTGADDTVQIHLAPTSDVQRRDDINPHVALCVPDLPAAMAGLTEAGIPFRQFGPVVFVPDPDGNVFELRAVEPRLHLGPTAGNSE